MNGYRRLVVLSFYFALALPAAGQPPAAESSDGLIAKIQAEAATLTKGPVSGVFDTLTSDVGKASLRLTKEQLEFSRRLEELVRAILKAGLIRGLDTRPLPSATELATRLDEVNKRHRQAVIPHAEAMALEGILSADQASPLRKATGRRRTGTLSGRYGPSRQPCSQVIHSVAELEELGVKQEQALLTGPGGMSSEFFQEVVVYRDIGGKFSTEQGQLEKILKLSGEQLDLASRLNRLNCDILTEWFSRRLRADKARLADEQAADWFDATSLLRDSFVAHAETLLLRGILSPSQADALLAFDWRHAGPSALADPELASRLNLSRTQRAALVEQLNNRRLIHDEIVVNLSQLMEFHGKNDELGRDIGVAAGEEKQRVVAEADSLVWSVLTPSQLRKLNQILRSDIRPQKPPASQKRRTRPS
jgi:hypothetical protein